jgi:hypothetical protein
MEDAVPVVTETTANNLPTIIHGRSPESSSIIPLNPFETSSGKLSSHDNPHSTFDDSETVAQDVHPNDPLIADR